MKFDELVNSILEEDLQQIEEGIITDKIKSVFNSALDKLETKVPELYNKIVSAASPEALKDILLTPAAISALGSLGFINSVAAAGVAGGEATSGEASAIMFGVVSSALIALYGVIKGRHGWSTPIDAPRSGSEIMSDIEDKRSRRVPIR